MSDSTARRADGEKTKPVRIGLLGASWVARWVLLDPLQHRSDFVVTAVAARSVDKAKEYAKQHGIPNVAADYAALVARDDVDLVYNGLVPSNHCEWTLRALEAGKHVLCEKPFAMNAAEARHMVTTAQSQGRVLLEAWHYRFHPLIARIQDILSSGILGRLRQGRARFEAAIEATPDQFRWRADLGGGALMDTGGYAIHALRTLIGREPNVLRAKAQRQSDIDTHTCADLDFGQGLVAQIECSMLLTMEEMQRSELYLEGEHGSLQVEGFALPQFGSRIRLETKSGIQEETPPLVSTYEAQLNHVAEVVGGCTAPVTGGADAIANMSVIDAIREAARRPQL